MEVPQRYSPKCVERPYEKGSVGWYFATLPCMRKPYPTDLSDAEWSYIEPHLPVPKEHGRPRIHSPREILDAIFYVLRSGCQWRMLPHDFPRWPTVYYFRKWRIDGIWERINQAIRERPRVRLQRNPQPSAGIVDSQSVKSSGVGGEERGVTTEARRSKAVSASSSGRHRRIRAQGEGSQRQDHMDYEGIKALLERAGEQFLRLSHLWLDALATGERTKARIGWRRP